MNNPFDQYFLNAAHISDIEKLRIDREDAVRICSEAIVGLRHNVLLYGTRGVGKTFLLRLIQKDISVQDNFIFPCIVNIASLIEYRIENDVGAFPRAVLLQLCAMLWTNLLGESYLDLRDSLNETEQEIHVRNKSEKTIRRVYRHLMLLNRTASSAWFNSIGFSTGLTGEKKEEAAQQFRYSNILPFEFAEFTHELIMNVLLPKGIKRIVILCDEANNMPIFQQEELLERYLELFSSKQIQFIFVAGMVPWDNKAFLPSCFETRFELKGFEHKKYVQELISRTNCDRPFTNEAIDVLFEAYSGHPRYTIEACSRSYADAVSVNLHEVSASLVLRVIKKMDEERQRYEEMIRKELK